MADSFEHAVPAVMQALAADLAKVSAEKAELVAALTEMRDVSACAFRVLVSSGADLDAFIAELRRVGIPDGFGQRANAVLAKVKATV